MDNQNNPAENKGQRTTYIKSEVDIPRQWFDRGEAIKVIRYYFQCGEKLIRIATGFFTVRGYNLIRESARGKQMYILVGLDDPGKERVRKALVEEIMRYLRTGLDVDRRQAVQELVEKMEGGLHISVFGFIAFRQLPG